MIVGVVVVRLGSSEDVKFCASASPAVEFKDVVFVYATYCDSISSVQSDRKHNSVSLNGNISRSHIRSSETHHKKTWGIPASTIAIIDNVHNNNQYQRRCAVPMLSA